MDTDPWAVADERAGEYLTHDPDDALVALAPHGGGIEPHTAAQAFRLAELLDGCSAWAFCGAVDGGGARARFHVTSTEIDPAAHRLLPTVVDVSFDRAVAFHGFDVDRPVDVYVGGRLSRSARETVADALRTTTDLTVRVAVPDDGLYGSYAGRRPENVVNRAADGGGLQLEQAWTARADHGAAVCRGVADGLARLRG